MELDIVKYVKSLIPHIDKEQVLEDLRLTETELQNIVLPAYSQAASFFGKDKFKSKENIKINDTITDVIKSSSYGRAPTFISEFYIRLQNIEKNVQILIKEINTEIGRDVVVEGISSKKAVLLRIAEKFSYISRFSLDLLNLVYMNEAVEADVDVRQISMNKMEIARAQNSVLNLARLLQGYGIDPKEFSKQIDKTPDMLLSRGSNEVIEANYSDKDMDAMSAPLTSSFTGNPIYHLRMLVAEWQTKRYKENQEKKKVLELRLLHLQLQKETKGSNPKLETEISYTQDRVSKISKYLSDVEADLEITA